MRHALTIINTHSEQHIKQKRLQTAEISNITVADKIMSFFRRVPFCNASPHSIRTCFFFSMKSTAGKHINLQLTFLAVPAVVPEGAVTLVTIPLRSAGATIGTGTFHTWVSRVCHIDSASWAGGYWNSAVIQHQLKGHENTKRKISLHCWLSHRAKPFKNNDHTSDKWVFPEEDACVSVRVVKSVCECVKTPSE